VDNFFFYSPLLVKFHVHQIWQRVEPSGIKFGNVPIIRVKKHGGTAIVPHVDKKFGNMPIIKVKKHGETAIVPPVDKVKNIFVFLPSS
jgi:hypothetical protein